MSSLKNMDWYQEIEEYTPDNVIVEVLEEDDVIDKPYFGIDYDSDRFDPDVFSIYADL